MSLAFPALVLVASASVASVSVASAGPPPPRVASTKPTRAESSTTHALVRRADGGYEYRNADAGFSATIHADGTVTFHKVARIKFDLPSVLGIGLKKRSKYDTFNDTPNTLERRGTTTDSKRDPVVDYGPYGAPPILVGFGGRMGGLADLFAGSHTSKAKRDFLAQTAPLRARLAADARHHGERAALVALMDTLATIWADPKLGVQQRRRQIFELWDECETATNDASHTAGPRARRIIDAFVRRVAPSSSAVGYTLRELDALNATRRSRATFDPYSVPSEAPTSTDDAP